jgi:pilus assembly protein TadC
MKSNLFRRFATAVPQGIVNHLESRMRVAGIRADVKELAGSWLVASLGLGILVLIAYILLVHGVRSPWLIADYVIAFDYLIIGFVVTVLMLELSTYYAIRDRATAMEKVLPDFLMLISSNMRAGLTPFTAFVRAARPEFGALSKEVSLSASQLSSSASLDDSLDELSTRFDSKMLGRVVLLFKKGAKAGGRIATLLSSSAEELRKIHDLRMELITTTRVYAIFLAFIVAVVMPFLLSVSTQFVTMFLAIKAQMGDTSISSLRSIPMFSGSILITPEEMNIVGYVALIMTSILVSALTGVIASGRPLDGVKYAPMFILVSVIMFMISRIVIGGLLSGVA